MDAIWYEKKKTNDEKVLGKCKKTLHNVYVKHLEKNIKNREYEKAGGHQRYKRDVEKTKDEYFSSLKDFKENEIISPWYEFVESMTENEATILEADKNMSQKEKDAEQKKSQEKLEELLKQQQRAQEDAFDKQKKIFKDHYDKLDKERREQQTINNERYIELINERMKKEAAQKEVEHLKSLQEATEKENARFRREKEAAEEQAKCSIIAQKIAEHTAECFKMENEEARQEIKEARKEERLTREKAIKYEMENEFLHRENEERRNRHVFVRIAGAIINRK